MNKQEAIKLLNNEGWTKADAQRALNSIDFKLQNNVDELIVRRAASQFAGLALIERQKSQAVQKRFVTIKTKKIEELNSQITKLKYNHKSAPEKQTEKLLEENRELRKANKILQEDNKNLKNIVDKIKFRLAVEIKEVIQLNDIGQIKKRSYKLLKSVLG